jgi:type I restriction enzyme S subunit
MEGQELPVGWVEVPLLALGQLIRGVTYSKKDVADSHFPESIPVLRANNIQDRHFVLANLVHVPSILVSEDQIVKVGDVVIATSSGSISVVGKAAQARTSLGMAFGAFCGLIRPSSEISVEYFGHFFSSEYYRTAVSDMARGVNINNLKKSHFESLSIPLPPLNEQRRIAAKLDTTLAAVEACRQRLDGVAATLKRFRQAVLAAATLGELTREWREERGDFSHWQEKGLAELGEFGRGRSRHRPRNDPRLYGGDYPFIQTGDVANAKGDWLAAHSQTYSNFGLAQSRIWPSSTLCITIAANIADTALLEYPACFPDSVVGFVADRAQVEPLFAKWMIDSVADKLESFAPATAQKNINLAILDQIVFSVPPLQEQTEIISRAQHLFTLADQLEARLTTARKVVDRLTPALLAKAFRGELVPQDPGDEPASVLLERIRAARQAEAGAGKPSRRGRPKAAANPAQFNRNAAPAPSEPLPPDLLTDLLKECGALSERALLAASELELERFEQQLFRELERGTAREVQANGQVLLEAVG